MSRGTNNFPLRSRNWPSRWEDGAYTSHNNYSGHMQPVIHHFHTSQVTSDPGSFTPAQHRPISGIRLSDVYSLHSFRDEPNPIARIRYLNDERSLGASRIQYSHLNIDPTSRPTYQQNSFQPAPRHEEHDEHDSKLSQEEQDKALKKLRREVYSPGVRSIAKRIGSYYRDKDRFHGNNNEKLVEYNNNDGEDGKRCAICLEDFEVLQAVLLTPCNHMFHEDCIVPWVKSNGQCPVCRFLLYEKVEQRTLPASVSSSSINRSNAADMTANGLPSSTYSPSSSSSSQELISLIRAMEEALLLERLTH